MLERSLQLILPWGPVFFGALIFAPMLAAVLEASGIQQVAGMKPLFPAMALGAAWGAMAKARGRWI